MTGILNLAAAVAADTERTTAAAVIIAVDMVCSRTVVALAAEWSEGSSIAAAAATAADSTDTTARAGEGRRRLGLGQCALRTPSCGCGGGHDDDELERRAQFQQRGRWGIQDSAVWAASAGPATAAVADSKHTRRELGHFVLPTRLQQRRQRPTAHT